jgi:uncharacterized protein (DUF305 family)
MRRLTLFSLFVSAFAVATSAPAAPMEQSPPNEDVQAAPAQLVVDGLYSDERFLDMMAAHHAVAVDMAKLEIQHGKRPELVQLARAIVAAQTREIDQMLEMKRRLYGYAHVTLKMNPQQMQNAGMIDPDRLTDQPDIDLAFIDSMIPHHGSALVMASVARLRSNDESIVKMARGIVDAQSREIGEMNGWRHQWFDGAP